MKIRAADSLVLSSFNTLTVALALGYSGLSSWWAAVALWIVPLPLVSVTTGYIIVDAVRSSTRKQALVAGSCFPPLPSSGTSDSEAYSATLLIGFRSKCNIAITLIDP